MRKLRLKIEDLSVESFEVGQGTLPERKTVHGQQENRPSQDYYCSNTVPADACGNTACGCVSIGYTCDRPSCMYNCPSKSPCPGGNTTYTEGLTNCGCGDDPGSAMCSHGCVTETA